MSDRTTQKRKYRITALVAAVMIFGTLTAPAHAGRKPNFGLYVSKYQMVVGSNSDFLIHPTGQYLEVNDHKWKQVRDAYQPSYVKTDDMDTKVLELHEQGWVMIGYSAFSSTEAPESMFHDGMTGPEVAGTKIGMKLRGYDPNMDMKGDPMHAAVWANAAMVVVQEGYAFSRLETKKDRIRTHDGRDDTRISGNHQGSYRGVYGGRSDGSSTTSGSMRSDGNWDENHQDVSAEAGTDGGSVSGSAGQSEGSNSDRTRYDENTRYSSTYAGGQAGQYQGSHNDRIQTRSEHWATALVDKHVNHYDYMVTFWKKADLSKLTLGAFTETVPRDLMREIGTRHARKVRAIIGGTPAYDADLWDGDVLLEIDGEPVRGADGYSDLLTRNQGREVMLTVWRMGEVFDLPVQLNDPR